MPKKLERENLSIITDVLLEPTIRMTATKFHLDILLVLFSVWWIYFSLFCGDKVFKSI